MSDLPPSGKQTGQIVERQVHVTAAFSGPLPPPDILRQYDAVIPGAAERILKMAEEQDQHRRRLESAAIAAGHSDARLGLILGFIIVFGFIGVATYAISKGASLVGLSMVIADLAALLGAYVYGKRSIERDLAEKRAALTRK